MDLMLGRNEEDDYKIFCLEGVDDVEENLDSDLMKDLEILALNTGITSVYKSCDSFEGFEESISNLLYVDKYFRDYKIIYLVFYGENQTIELNDFSYGLEEIAELFEGKLTNKIIHFANTKTLDLEDEDFQYFLDVTGAKALSGYIHSSPVFSSVLDQHFFALHQDYDDVIELVEKLFDKYASLCTKLGFRLYY